MVFCFAFYFYTDVTLSVTPQVARWRSREALVDLHSVSKVPASLRVGSSVIFQVMLANSCFDVLSQCLLNVECSGALYTVFLERVSRFGKLCD